jgi:glycosyltransferase involved in cell wall biosynthesis
VNVVIAAWHLQNSNVGLGRYCRGLIEAIGRVDDRNQYEILIPSASPGLPSRPNITYRLIRFPVFKRRFWEQAAPLLAGRHDILHFPHDSRVAWKREKFIVTIHDLKPLLFESLRLRWNLNRMIERLFVGTCLERVDHILTDSYASRRDIIHHLQVPVDRVTVVYPGVDGQRFRPASDQGEPHSVELRRPVVLSVAGADPTKNINTLIDAFGRLPPALRDAHDLILVGDFRHRHDVRERVRQAGIESRTVFMGVVGDERLIRLYQHATVFVFPSLYEGFGFPVLEAMACGCPVISSDAASLPEVAGEAAILVNPTDVRSLTQELERVLKDPALRETLRRRGLRQAAFFPWDRTAQETVAVYEKVAGER